MRRFSLALAVLLAGPGVFAQSARFPDATESVEQLISSWEETNSMCRGANAEDVKVAVACLSRSVYGVALNERDWCYGRQGEANAEMEWHECEGSSLRFPAFEIPKP